MNDMTDGNSRGTKVIDDKKVGFDEITDMLPNTPKYRISVYGNERYGGRYRIGFLYYIALLSEDPSNIRKTMSKFNKEGIRAFENGKTVPGMESYRVDVSTAILGNFHSIFLSKLEQWTEHYTCVVKQVVVQYSNTNQSPVVFTSLPNLS